MPTYDYVCDACGHKFELFQSINDPVKRKCPECGRQKLRRLIGAGAAIMFKGSGFYQTDYRSEKYKQRAAADKPPSEGSTGDGKSSGDKSASDKSSGDKSTGGKPSDAKSQGSGESKSHGKSPDSKGPSPSSGRKR